MDYPLGTSDYPRHLGTKGIWDKPKGKKEIWPSQAIENMPGGENPEDLLESTEEAHDDAETVRVESALKSHRLRNTVLADESGSTTFVGSGQGGSEMVGVRKSAGTVKVEKGKGSGWPAKNVKEKREFMDTQRGKAKRK